MNRPSESELPLFAQLLRQCRSRSGRSVKQLARDVDVAESTFRNAENGRGTPKLFDNIDRVYPGDAQAIRDAWVAFQASDRGQAVEDDENTEDMFRRNRPKQHLDGDWYALWETTVGGEQVLNSEAIQATWTKRGCLWVRNEAPSPENVEGGYLWQSELQIFDHCYLMGVYTPLDATIISKGTMFGVLHRSGRYIRGIWVGCNYDSELTEGHFVFSRTVDKLWDLMARELQVPVERLRQSSV